MSKGFRRWALFGLTLAIAIVINLPIILMFLNSFQTTAQMQASQSVIPEQYSLVNYLLLVAKTPFFSYLVNSLVIALGAAVLGVLVSLLAGYALSRYRGRLLDGFSTSLFIIQMFPFILALIPLFVLFRTVGLINNPLSVILVYALLNMPFITWMARSYFDTIPLDIEEAAMIDGLSRIGAFFRIVLPLSGPGVAAVSIFAFLFAYNEYFVANVFLRTLETMTLPLGIQMFIQQFSTDWGGLFAAASLMMIPTFVLFLFVQRFIVAGATAGGVKG